MKPLQAVAMGLLIVMVTARLWGGFDYLADPVGWLLVLLGVRRLPTDLPQRTLLLVIAAVAGLVSIVLWVPDVVEAVTEADPALFWGVSLAQLVFCVLLPWQLATVAADTGDETARRWLRTAAGLAGLSVVLPPIVFGGDVVALKEPVFALAALSLLMLVVLMFAYSGRPWAQADPASGTDPR